MSACVICLHRPLPIDPSGKPFRLKSDMLALDENQEHMPMCLLQSEDHVVDKASFNKQARLVLSDLLSYLLAILDMFDFQPLV